MRRRAPDGAGSPNVALMALQGPVRVAELGAVRKKSRLPSPDALCPRHLSSRRRPAAARPTHAGGLTALALLPAPPFGAVSTRGSSCAPSVSRDCTCNAGNLACVVACSGGQACWQGRLALCHAVVHTPTCIVAWTHHPTPPILPYPAAQSSPSLWLMVSAPMMLPTRLAPVSVRPRRVAASNAQRMPASGAQHAAVGRHLPDQHS